MKEGHTQCGNTRCGAEFPVDWLFHGPSDKGWVSPDTGDHYCSKQCCEIEEGDPMQTAFNFNGYKHKE